MDKSGQLTFSDDPSLNGLSQVNQLIQEGAFQEAVDKLDELMDADPDYPGLIEAYRTAKFWLNRSDELSSLDEGRRKADFLMKEWKEYEEYVHERNMQESSAYRSVMMYVFNTASEHYRRAYVKQEDTGGDFDLLLNVGACFLRLGDYQKTVDTLEYASRSFNSNASLLAMLAEASYHLNDIPKSLWYFREAFFIDPSGIDLSLIKAEPVRQLAELAGARQRNCSDVREWIPVYGFLSDIFYVRKNLQERQVDNLKEQIYALETSYQRMNRDQIEESNILPRLITRYLWLLDYFEFQQYSLDRISQIRDRLLQIDRVMFEEYFRKQRR
jgi:tetratricopeptide (TPR) repeat protein